ncbi:MAG: macro domain-containing protein [Candidatus Tantalella remota]|nr:macro domain-containing protein [Candidatus Tantalella remota]
MGKIVIKQGNITTEKVEAIVNAANTRLAGGGGVDGAIQAAAGPSVLEECKRIGRCRTGEAVITEAGELYTKKIIHTPGPVWNGGKSGETELLRSCYENSFEIARSNGLKTIAFPAISTGVYRYPLEEATKIAIRTGMEYIDDFDEIVYVCFSPGDFEVYKRIYEELK